MSYFVWNKIDHAVVREDNDLVFPMSFPHWWELRIFFIPEHVRI
ncbi:hypothetical protein SHEWT2_03963 [Shewanella hafniensis]|nr:hypothetical protein [Shewanella sp. W3-18-1]CAD6366064.1 hypothetical protein SHEWT2_03963 [Shewanella hafniensis]